MFDVPNSVRHLFESATVSVHQTAPARRHSDDPAEEIALYLISKFSGLHIGTIGPSIEFSKSDVHFFSEIDPIEDASAAPWNGTVGKLSAFASACNEHLICMVSSVGEFYVFSVPEGELYKHGATFGQTMEGLLLGHTHGIRVAREA
jgi:hypothetical protein